MSERSPEQEKRHKEFILQCREVRLWLASHPGAINIELVRKFGKKVDFCLGYMSDMRIVEPRRENSREGFTSRWYVIPQ